jgi:hypothetical protein
MIAALAFCNLRLSRMSLWVKGSGPTLPTASQVNPNNRTRLML